MSYLPTLNPIFSGNVRVPTATPGDNDTTAASTAFVTDAIATAISGIDLSNYAALADNETITGTWSFTGGNVIADGVNFAAQNGGKFRGTGSVASTTVLDSLVSGDSNVRFDLDADGGMAWGGGSGAVDVTLARTGANVLSLGADDFIRAAAAPVNAADLTNKAYVDAADAALDTRVDSLEAAASSYVTLAGSQTISGQKTFTSDIQLTGDTSVDFTGSADTEPVVRAKVAGDVNWRSMLRASGELTFGDGTTLDTTFGRVAANVLGVGANDSIRVATAPTNAHDLTNKAYVDSVAQGLQLKASVRAATTGNVTLSGTQTIDGVALIAGDRVLVKNQTNGAENGIYVVASGAWSRSADLDEPAELTSGIFTFVEEGTAQADSGWVVTTNDPIVLGTDPVTWTQFSGAGQITAGAGLTKSGNTLAVGQGTGIAVNADDVAIDPSYVMTLGTNQTVTGVKTFDVSNGAVLFTEASNGVSIIRTNVDSEATYRFNLRMNGSMEWGNGTLAPDTNLYRSAADTLKTDDAFHVGGLLSALGDLSVAGNATFTSAIFLDTGFIENTSNAATDLFLTSWVTGTNPRFQIAADGKHEWGSGSGALDTNLYRSTANQLKTDDSLVVGTDLQVDGHMYGGGVLQLSGGTSNLSFTALGAATTNAIQLRLNGDTQYRHIVNADGTLEWGAGGASAPDVTLYRSFTNTLRTNGALVADVSVSVKSGLAGAITVGDGSNPVITFGSAADTNIYRSAANTLKTDDAFHVAGLLQALGNADVDGTLWVDGAATANSTLTVNGRATLDAGVSYKTATKTANYTVDLALDHIILVDTATASGTVTITLPASHTEGDTIVVKDSGGQAETKNVVIDPADADTIDGLTTFTLNVNYMGATLVSNGTNWFVV